MSSASPDPRRDHDVSGPPEPWWPTAAALGFVVGILASSLSGAFLVWWLLAAVAWVVLWRRRKGGDPHGRRACTVIVMIGLGASWSIARSPDPHGPSLSAYLQHDGVLAELEGVVVTRPELRQGSAGPFAAFGYEAPTTHFELRVDRVLSAEGDEAAQGLLLAKIDAADHRVQLGQRIRVRGWLAPIGPPMNPGDFDYRAFVAERGVVGRISMATRGNWDLLAPPGVTTKLWGAASWLERLREGVASRAAWSLGLGMGDDAQTLGLLQTLLLGETQNDIDTLRDQFRDVGLAHLLSISGAHLGILMGLVWLVARLVVPHPSRAATLVLAVLGLYLLAVPLRVPIVRASVMAGLFFAGIATGRRLGANTLLSLAALIVLAWRPSDLFSPGFQLSFVTVWALLRFTQPVSRWIWPDSVIDSAVPGVIDFRGWIARRLADVSAVSLVATATAMPMVAYHFQMVNPLSVVLSVLALPALTAVLGLGYLKVLVGFVWPSGALLLSGPLRWAGGALALLVEQAADWPGATVRLVYALPGWWVFAALGVVWWWFAGGFRQRKAAGVAALAVVVGVMVWVELPEAGRGLRGNDTSAKGRATVRSQLPGAGGMSLTMIAVGDGSCFVLRVDGKTLMFDCGSQPYPLIGRRSVVPTLRKMGIDRLDVLVISHADLDHYNGTLDVMDAMPVGEVWVSADVPDEARAHPDRATALLWEQLRARGARPRTVTRGDQRMLGGAQLDILWPPAEGWDEAKGNDRSVVMSVRSAGHRLLLNGDIQQAAITALLDAGVDLSADVADLPHHGSFVDASPSWLDAVGPQLVLQSSGPARLRRDRWAEVVQSRGIPRLVSDRVGAATVTFGHDGALSWQTFHLSPQGEAMQSAGD
ncbi:MAG: ComEC/Rec2 family competence protein [Planctomycetota bacterium]